MIKASALFFLLTLMVAVPAFAASVQESNAMAAGFPGWLRGMEQDAIAEGISPQTVQSALGNVTFDDHVIELDQKQPENTVTFADYVKRIVSADRVKAGREAMSDNAQMLGDVSRRYGVPAELIVALWGVESSFGHNSGDYSIIDSLATLAYEGRRAAFFKTELIDALRIVDQQHIPPSHLRGSWAGAMGQCQFMPSTYLNFAASATNRAPDIWENEDDVFTSIANFILADGWDSRIQGWGREVTLSAPLPASEVGLTNKHLLSEWAAMGVTDLDGSPMEGQNIEASLIAPDGADGRHFLVYDNYRAIMKWNRSTYFATSVGLLADRIK